MTDERFNDLVLTIFNKTILRRNGSELLKISTQLILKQTENG